MRNFVAAHSEHPVGIEAATEVLADLSERLEGDPDLGIIFASGRHRELINDIASGLTELLGVQTVLGTAVSGVVSGGREVESGSALSVWIGETGPTKPIRLEAIDSGRTILGLPSNLDDGSIIVLVADPFTFPVDNLLEALNREATDLKVIGGLASAGQVPGEIKFLLNGSLHNDGAVGIVLKPGRAQTIVSQGCRPIGKPWVITEGSGRMIRELGGRKAIERLQATIDALSVEDRVLAAKGLHIGVVANEQTERFEQGDFLIRSLLGAERSSGALAIGDRTRIGQIVQFHVRDATSATEDLRHQLSRVERPVQGSLLFTCTGRGTNMFAEPHHDAQIVDEMFRDIATAGMFSAGEIGPVGSHNALHSYSTTILLF